jgi:hypothetical protein
MKALTICQPYASLIVGWDGIRLDDLKRVENRPRPYSHQGPLLIHAGLSTSWLNTWDGVLPPTMPFGALLGIVDVAACLPITTIRCLTDGTPLSWLKRHRHASGPYCLVLERPRRFLTPIPRRGQVGLFEVPEEVFADAAVLDVDEGTFTIAEATEEKDHAKAQRREGERA